MAKCFDIQHGMRWQNGQIIPNAIGHFGGFSTRRDAERWLQDNPDLPTPKIYESTATVTCDWGADCPDCQTRADRAWDKGYTGTIELWWRCPKCSKEFTR